MALEDLNSYGDELKKGTIREGVRTNLYTNAGIEPDQYAQLQQAAKRLGMAPSLVPQSKAERRRLEVAQDPTIDTMPDVSPATASFLSDSDNAKLASDDIDNMTAMEKTFSVLKNAGRALASVPHGVSSGFWGVSRAVGEFDQMLTKPLRNLVNGFTGSEYQGAGAKIAEVSKEMQIGAEATAKAIKGDTSKAGLVERGFYSGVESLGQNLLTLPLTIASGGSMTPMLSSMTASTGGRSYGQARDKDIDVLPSMTFGASQAAIEYATELLPALALVKNLKAKSGIMKFAKDYVGKELVGEESATLMQDLNEWAVLNPDKPFSSYVADRPAAFAETAIATLVGSGGMVVTAKGLEKVGASVTKYQTAKDSRDFLLALGDTVQASKLRERMPEKLQELIKGMKDEHGTPEHAYVDAQVLTDLWQSAGFDPQKKAQEMLSNPASYVEALATGSEVAIPMEEFAARFTSEEYYQTLAEDVRLGAGSATMREANEWNDESADIGTPIDSKDALTQLVAASGDEIWKQSTTNGTIGDQGSLNVDGRGNVILTRFAPDRSSLTKDGKAATPDEMKAYIENGGGFGGNTVATSMLSNWGSTGTGYGGVVGTITIPVAELAQLIKEGKAGLASVGNGELVLSGEVAEQYLSHIDGKSIRPETGPKTRRQELRDLMTEAEGIAPTPSDIKVYDDVVGQLIGTDMERGTAQRNATLMQAVFRTLGSRMGVDAFELYGKYPLTINRPLPGVLSNRDTFDTQLDPLLDRLRSGDIPSASKAYGPSLMEFMREKGISDDRGDLASMEVDKGMKAFTKKLLRKDGLSLDKARELAVESGYLPEGSDTNALLDALADDLRGKPKYSSEYTDTVILDELTNLQQVKDYLDRQGIDLAGMDNVAVRKELDKQRELFQRDKEIKRAFFRFGNGTFNIGLLENADLSSFSHESAHFYLEILADLSSQESTPQQIKDDFAAILKWTGATSREGMTVAQLEQFARGFESYLMEGKSPSVELQSVFSRMKAWMVQVYKELRNLNVKLNDDVRGVFDRLVASDEEIEAARTRQNMKEVFATAEDMGVSEAEFKIYRKQGEKAHASQIEKLEREYMEEFTRQQRQWWADGLAKMAEEVDKETKETPVYQAIQVLTKGVTFDGAETPLKLDRKTLEKQYGKSLVKRLPRGIYIKEGGLTADAVAEMMGFESGDEMVKAIASTPSRKDFIKAEADRRMRKEHGDLLTDGTAADEATLAVHTDEQAKVLMEELRAMRKLQVTAEKINRAKEGDNREARKAALSAIPPAEFFKDLARDLIAQKTIEELLPYRYQQAEAKAAREAFEAAAKKDWAKASEAKQRQILNHYLYREAASIKKIVDAQVKKWADLVNKSDKRLAASRDMNVVTAARAVLSRFGIGQAESDAMGALSLIQKYDANLYESLQMAVDAATQEPKPWKQLNVIEFTGLADAVNNLWHLSRRSKIAMIDGMAINLDEINDDLLAQLTDKNRPFTGLGKKQAVSDIQKLKIGFLGMGAALRRVEHWATEMDGGDSGPFRKFIIQPIFNAVTEYKTAKKPVVEKLRDIFKQLDSDTFGDKKIAATELDYTFKNKGELLHAILHTGNESNLQKLLIGRGWADFTEQRELDPTRWQDFLKRVYAENVLTAKDYAFVQDVWDLLESTKPAAQKAHHDMYGYYFSEITANPVDTPFGTFRGGYVPAITDPYIVESAAERADQENLLQENSSSMFPASVAKGFTMSRVAGYNRELLLDLSLLASHVDKVLKMSYMGPVIQDVGRILGNSELKGAFHEINPSWSGEMLLPWLKRTARQSVETKASGWGGKKGDDFLRGIRRRTGLQLMAVNVANAMQQLTGVFPAMAKVSPRKMGSALFQFTKNPMDLTNSISDKSPWMRDRLDNEISQISGELHNILTQSKYEQVQEYGVKIGYWASGAAQHIVDVIVWQAAYEQAIKEGQDEKSAVEYSDSVVRQTQGSFAPEDASAFETGTAFTRVFTQFYAYFNMITNLSITEAKNTVSELGWMGGSPKLFYIYMMTFALPSFVSELIMSAMRGKVDDDEDGEYMDDVLFAFFKGQGRAATALIPGAGQFINASIGRFTKMPQDDRMSVSPAVGTLEASAGVVHDLYDIILNDKELKRAHIRDVFTLVGMATGLPTAALARPLGYAVAAESGATQPANQVDYIRGLITGYAPK